MRNGDHAGTDADAPDRRISRGLFIVVLVAYASFFNGAGWNANANFDLTRALVERQTLHIDGYAQNTGDVSLGTGGHTYSNKAPGLSFLGAIPYTPMVLIARASSISLDDGRTQTILLWILTVLVCGTSGALIALLLYGYGRREGVDRTPALAVSLVIAFGTYVFGYSTVYFAHVPCAAFLLLAFVWLDDRPLLAGMAAAVAGTIFCVAIPIAAVLAVLAASRSLLRAGWFVAGGIPFAILLGVYQHLCFGRPWRTSLENSPAFTTAGYVFGVLAGPKLEVVKELLIGTRRGLLPLSPVLLLAVAGAMVMIHRRLLRRELAAIAIVIAIFVLANASFNYWDSGFAMGPRYILPIVPFLAIPMLFAGHWLLPVGRRGLPLRIFWALLATISIAINFLIVSVDVIPGGNFRNPFREYIVPVFLTATTPEGTRTDGSHVAVNAQAPDEYCAYCRYAPGHPRALWASFNLGELVLSRGSRASVIPIALWIFIGSFWLMRTAWVCGRAGPPA